MTDHAPDISISSHRNDPADFRTDNTVALLLNKSAILQTLTESRITSVVVGFSEQDFVTEVEFIVAKAGDAICRLPQTMVQLARGGLRRQSVDLSKALTIFLDDLLGAGRDTEAGVEGTLRIDAVAMTIVVEALRREVVHHPFKRIV